MVLDAKPRGQKSMQLTIHCLKAWDVAHEACLKRSELFQDAVPVWTTGQLP
jgi:hypothetical protein